ncbi:S-formylglutathione hydrolase [Synechococcus sp. BA-124 BA4]|uniref:S-formylglutathione hydrolase n=1 Tax=unclassified Synechococcus TaxID=2626047 RepID=UPI0018CFBF2F|nr:MULTISPECIES: S-formylglutathione hydrolase [unclassified Synechococcus]MEA5400612.1 S-formylglutathione hydrolase [Synechococcus sp. BA-124 BA4]QPN56200.1 S-formylglutathione hydrolase [Synechococcus sp. CBW1107]CAK6698763.1 S-formylglutathione hydrolase YeiG [Synechococcus sp. CBW1107]
MLTLLSENRSFAGAHRRYRHHSALLDCAMTLAVYLPPQALAGASVPALYWLSGLTCTDENFMQKAGAHRLAASLGLALIAPDTSPRGPEVPGDPDGAWDFGHGAGFYLNASEAPWARHYRMHDYVVEELPELLERELPLNGRRGVSGHSMGGHGALVCALRHPGLYRSVSAFAPISHPSRCPWGEKAFSRYLGPDRSRWREWDACELIVSAPERLPLLIDQGLDDPFLESQLRPDDLEEAARSAGHPLELRRQPGYDHSYFFIASFIDDHLRHHAAALLPPA